MSIGCRSENEKSEGVVGVKGFVRKTCFVFIGVLCLFSVVIAGDIDLNNLFNYSNQSIPDYITKDNTDGNQIDDATATLGRVLFYDKALSIDNTVSCASCHDPKKGWSNGEPNAAGVDGQRGGRNSPTVINTAYQRFQFWDGRAGGD